MKKVASKRSKPTREGPPEPKVPTRADLAEAAARLERASVALLRQEAFYAHLLTCLRRVYTVEVPTAAVSATGSGATIWINPFFFVQEITDAERIGVLKHELLHLMFKHPWRDTSCMPDNNLRNIAADLVVNQFVAPHPLPGGAVVLESFPGLERDQSMDWYYKKLRAMDASPDARAKKALAVASRTCEEQGCSAKWHEKGGDTPSDGSAKDSMPRDMDGGLGEAVVRGMVARAKAKTSLKEWGRLPLGVQRMVDELCAPPKNSWRRLLRLFAGRGIRTVIRSTRRKESVRFPGQPGVKIKRLNRIVVAVDTSGSIGEDQLNEFLNEIRGVARAGAEITLIERDCQIQNVSRFGRAARPQFKGGGGTSFDPVMKWLREHSNSGIGGCIYFTDGAAPRPTIDPRCRVLWMLAPGMEVMHGWRTVGLG